MFRRCDLPCAAGIVYTIGMMPDERRSAPKKPSAPRQRLTARALLEAKRLSSPKIHPDGQRVAFVVTEADFEESRYVSHLWLTEYFLPETSDETEPAPEDADTTSENGEEAPEDEAHDPTRQLTFSRDGEARPEWSPDGHYLAFLSCRPDETESAADEDDDDPKDQVWILPIDGGEARKVTSAKEGVQEYAWTPDSRGIVYLAPEPRPRPVENVRKEERERRKNDPVVENEDRLRRQLWRVDVEERKPKLLLTGDYGIHEFALSPDGERLCYVTNYTGEWNDYHIADLWIVHLADGTTFKLVERAGGKYRPRWSPDGKRIAFLSWLDPHISYSRESLFVAEVPSLSDVEQRAGEESKTSEPPAFEATTPRLLTELDYDLSEFEWSAHDGTICAIADEGTGDGLYALIGEATRLDAGGWAERYDLNLDTQTNAMVYVQESGEALPEIFLRDEHGESHQLTKLNAEFTETYSIPRQEIVRWDSSDGLSIEGIVTYPTDYAPGKRCPLIVQIHGGPKGRSAYTLLEYTYSTLWATEGYAVLRPNYRGSSGYGNAFAIANRRDLGGGDFRDIMAGVDWCIAQGIADPDQLGVMGGSYGGYMTNWVIGHTDRFRAAVSMFGVFHLQTDYSNSELSRWDNDYLDAYYWEDPEIYRRLSPGTYLENIKTPTLILHGDEDNNTFISNSKELYQALRHRGVITQFVHYPREGHGLREPNHKLDEIRRSLAWMDRYVRHGGANPGIYRQGDVVPSAEGALELSVTRAEVSTFLGQPRPAGNTEANKPEETVLLEVALVVQNRDTRQPTGARTLFLSDIRLELQTEGQTRTPVGVPLEVHGGKMLLEGDNLRLELHPDTETNQFAFGCAVVFRLSRASSAGLLHVTNFAPVALTWTAESETDEETGKNEASRLPD